MKSHFVLTTLMTLSLTSSSFGSCYDNYQERRKETEEVIKNSNYQQTLREASALSISTNIVVLAALSATGAGGVLPSTIGGLGLVSSSFFAKKYIEIRTDDDAQEALINNTLLEASLNLLKEARLGQGPNLAQALTIINQNVSPSISMKDLADVIVSQDTSRLYCQSERIMSPAGIIAMATEELKQAL